MSLEQIDIETIYDRNTLQKLSLKQLCDLLSITMEQFRKFGFSKDNLIEIFLTKQPEQ
jgi:predicted house-cleaning noncanonical NTP pyrophosphatase (MazG superfamily)